MTFKEIGDIEHLLEEWDFKGGADYELQVIRVCKQNKKQQDGQQRHQMHTRDEMVMHSIAELQREKYITINHIKKVIQTVTGTK